MVRQTASPAPAAPTFMVGVSVVAGVSSSAGWVGAGTSPSSACQLATSCASRSRSRCGLRRLPSITRCRLSFLRAAVQLRWRWSRPVTSWSTSDAQAAPSASAGRVPPPPASIQARA